MTDSITVAFGDGIGPEIMSAALRIIQQAGADLRIETIEVGKRIYEQGMSTGISDSSWETIKRNKVVFKAPITTPQGGGYKSLNVTMRRRLGLYANVRPVKCYAPYVDTNHPEMDIVIVRENEEGLYAGIEHRPTTEAFESLKLITRRGCEKISHFAFLFAQAHGRKKVSCLSKDNILKISDGHFHKIFQEVSKDYSDIESEHYIVDIGTARIANRPEDFDVVLTGNLYGDIISDIVAETSGSVGLAGSANIGEEFAMFEAVHGSAPDIAGQGIANPSGLINAAVMMLVYLGQTEVAANIKNAWLKTIEDGVHTGDIYDVETSKEKVGTEAFADAVIERLGQKPVYLKPEIFKETKLSVPAKSEAASIKKELKGVDIFCDQPLDNIEEMAKTLQSLISDSPLQLEFIDMRGLVMWPDAGFSAGKSDYWRARFTAEKDSVTHQHIVTLLGALSEENIDFAKTVQLYHYNGERGYSLAQGQ